MFKTGPSHQFDRPLREGEMRGCIRCGGAQLGPGAWGYAGLICRCWASAPAEPYVPSSEEVDIFHRALRRSIKIVSGRLDQRGKPIIRVKAGRAPS